jgi:hypothetical protein
VNLSSSMSFEYISWTVLALEWMLVQILYLAYLSFRVVWVLSWSGRCETNGAFSAVQCVILQRRVSLTWVNIRIYSNATGNKCRGRWTHIVSVQWHPVPLISPWSPVVH